MPNKNLSKCIICSGSYRGMGHNAEPVKDGRCCITCNYTKVIPARMDLMQIAHSERVNKINKVLKQQQQPKKGEQK